MPHTYYSTTRANRKFRLDANVTQIGIITTRVRYGVHRKGQQYSKFESEIKFLV